MKRYLVLAGMILLAGVIFLFDEKARVETGESHIPSPEHISSPELTYAKTDVPHVATNSHFLDNINLSYEPVAKIRDPDPQPARLTDGKYLPVATSVRPEQLLSRLGNTSEPVLTVADRKLNYELLGSEGFSLKLNLAPGYPNPEALIPTRLDPGVGVSIKF